MSSGWIFASDMGIKISKNYKKDYVPVLRREYGDYVFFRDYPHVFERVVDKSVANAG